MNDPDFQRGLELIWRDYREAVVGGAILCGLITLAGIAALISLVRKEARSRREWLINNPPPPPPREIATMREDISLTGGGGFCLVMLIITVIYAGGRFMVATSIAEITNGGLGLIAGVALWGLGVALGRRRTYVVFNVPAASERNEPKL